jgi:hypothetical protein
MALLAMQARQISPAAVANADSLRYPNASTATGLGKREWHFLAFDVLKSRPS